jgi:MFS family permease
VSRTLWPLWSAGFAFYFSFYLLLGTLPLYAKAIGVSEHALGVVFAAFAIASMVMKPLAGWGSDHLGRRPMMLTGAAVFVLTSLAYGWTASALGLAIVRFLHGCGMGLYPTAASAVAADVAPPERRGEVIGFLGAAANLAMAVGPLAGIATMQRAGYPALFGLAAACALLALGLSLAVRETLETPSAAPFGVGASFSRAAVAPATIAMLLMVTYGFQVSFMPIHIDRHGGNPGVFYLAFALVVALVRGHAGRLSDRLGRAPVAAAGLVIAALALGVLAASSDATLLAVAGALYGVGFGTAQPALAAWCVDGAAAEDRGRAMGTYYTAMELGIAVGSAVLGLGVSVAGFGPTCGAAGAVALAGAALAATRRSPALTR